MFSRSGDFRKGSNYYLPFLLIISVISRFPFVLDGFGEIDATKIAVSVIDMLRHGPDAAFTNFYFSDVIPLYILYLKSFMKLLDHNYSYLPLVMNYTNAVVGSLMVIPAYMLIRRISNEPVIAFCAVLALIFSPSFYQATIMGFPHLIALFFLLISLDIYLSGLDGEPGRQAFLRICLACVFLTTAFLFKSDFVLASGVYIGLLFMRKIKDRKKILGAFTIILASGIMFLFFRDIILGPNSGTTMSKEGLSKWYDYSLIIPTNIKYFIEQAEPIAYGAGIATSSLAMVSFIYCLLQRKFHMLVFVLSWAAVPMVFWFVMIGNNARHNMIATLPLLVMITAFFHKKTPRYTILLTLLLILGNFFAVPPSSSILTPSGRIFKSSALLKERMTKFRSAAKQITAVDADKCAVIGFFHNPHVAFEIMKSSPSYEAEKIGREDYRIRTYNREYVLLYFVVTKAEKWDESIDYILDEYGLHDYLFVSVTYDLRYFSRRGLKTKTFDIIDLSDL